MVLPIPIGDRCASVSVPTDVSPSHSNKPVLLKVYSRESGDVASVQMIESSGDPRLDDAAYDAALDCRFQVGTLEGNPAKTIVKLRYTWDASAAPNDTPEQIAARANHPLQGVTFFGQEAGPQDLSCKEPKISPPQSIMANLQSDRTKVNVAFRVSAPSGEVSAVFVGPKPGNPQLNDYVEAAYRGMTCKTAMPLRKSVWMFRFFEFKR